jgi:hypothetical protein
MVRITFSNYGRVNQMFFEKTEQDAVDIFWRIFGEPDPTNRNTGGIKIISIGHAVDTKDRGGFEVGSKYQEVA